MTTTSGTNSPTRSPSAGAGALMTLASMTSAQLGLAASVGLVGQLGALGAASLRLFSAGVIMLAVTRPWRFRYSRAALRAGIILGLATAGMSILFMCAAARLPLGTASALEFLGPLTVAVCGNGRRAPLWPVVAAGGVLLLTEAICGKGRRGPLWPLLAAGGVLLLTEPWSGAVDGTGIAFALGAAACYAGYILFTRRIGDHVGGIAGLGISLPVAALVATVAAGPSTAAKLSPALIAIGIGLALLVPVVPFILEMHSLRRLSTAAFSTLVCLEPAIGTIVGLVLLGQVPHALTVVGIACVITAGAGSVRSGAREHPVPGSPGAAQSGDRSPQALGGDDAIAVPAAKAPAASR